MSKEEGNNSFLWGSQRWPILSNSADQNGSGSAPKYNQIEQEHKELDAPAVNNNKKHGSCKQMVKGEVAKHRKGTSREDSKGEKGSESDHEIHIWTERERRKKMRNMFSNLHALLPQLPPKADKSAIVDEAVNYIKTLEKTLQKLEEKKVEKGKLEEAKKFTYEASSSREAFLADQGSSSYHNSNNLGTKSSNLPSISRYPVLFETWTSSNVVLNICGDEAQISVCSTKKPGLFTAITYVLEKHNIEILSAHLSSDSNRCFYMIQAHVNGASNQFAEASPVEEVYRQAAGEIIGWISS